MNTYIKASVALATLAFASGALAGPSFTIDAGDVSYCAPVAEGESEGAYLETVEPNTGGANLLQNGPYGPSTCLYYDGNDDQHGWSEPDPNFGYLDDGFMNMSPIYDMILDPEDLQALKDPENAVDPGWIHLAHMNGSVNEEDMLNVSYDTIGSFNIGEFITLTFMCNDAEECNEVDWTLTVDSDPTDIQAALGRPATFDHLTFVVKAGNGQSGGGTLVYDFDFTEIFTNDGGDFNFLTPYKFTGTLDTAGLGSKAISHMNVWARDPLLAAVNAPATLGMAVLSMGLLAGFRRKK